MELWANRLCIWLWAGFWLRPQLSLRVVGWPSSYGEIEIRGRSAAPITPMPDWEKLVSDRLGLVFDKQTGVSAEPVLLADQGAKRAEAFVIADLDVPVALNPFGNGRECLPPRT